MGYQIKMVSDMLGIPKNTLIAWERRYAIVDPTRTDGGYRVYSAEDIRRISMWKVRGPWDCRCARSDVRWRTPPSRRPL